MQKYKEVLININNIKQGDTIKHNGVLTTVCKKDIKYCSFIGYTIFGDSYKCGYKPVIKIIL